MSYTDFIYDPFIASLTVKKIGKAKDILKLKDITTIDEKSESSNWYDQFFHQATFLEMQKQQNFCTSDNYLIYSNIVKYPRYYNCKLDGDKSCLIGNIEGKCKGVKKVIFNEQLNSSDNGDWGFYNNKNGRQILKVYGLGLTVRMLTIFPLIILLNKLNFYNGLKKYTIPLKPTHLEIYG